MSKSLFRIVSVLMVLAFFVSACGGAAPTTAPAAPAPTTAPAAPAPTTAPAAPAPTAAPAAPAATAAPAAAAPAAGGIAVPSGSEVAGADFMKAAPAGTFKVTGTFYWVQNTAWHPVHQLTQQSFLAGCADNGLKCELAITDDGSLEAWLAVAEQALARPDVKGLAMWIGGNPAAIPFVKKAVDKGVAISLPHFPIDQGFYGNGAGVVQIAADTTKYPDPVAKAMCDELKAQNITKGSVGVTENGFNVTEDMVAKVFKESMNKYCPTLTVLPVQLEGAEPTKAIAVAVSIIQANPDIVAGFSTTGGGPTTWAGAQKETGKKLVSVGMDYTRVNLDLVKSGQVFGVVAQPLYEENWGSAKLLAMIASGQKVPYWTILGAPLVTKANMADYYGILDKLEPKFRATAPAPTAAPAGAAPAAGGIAVPSGSEVAGADFMKAAPAGTFKVTGTFYWVQNTAWHPVHQLTQQSFLAGCADNGLKCELAITDDGSLEAWLAVAEQALARPDVKGLAMWIGGNPAAIPFVKKAVDKGVAISLPHFPIDQGFYGNGAGVVQIAADTTKYPDPVAKAMCDELKAQNITKGSVGVTENGFNVTEDMVAKVFKESMNKYCPTLTVLPVQLEGAEPTKAIAVAVSIIQANPDIVAGFSTTGGGPTTWAGAQKETGKKLVSVGMDYTRVNLDLVKSGQVFGVVAQPLYEENWGSAKLLAMIASGQKVPYWTILGAPLVTKANMADYYGILDKLEPKFRATAPAPTATK